MEKIRRYLLDGIELQIPVEYDEQSKHYIEMYPNFADNPVWTIHGYQVMFAGEDACSLAEEESPGGCPDCGSCKYFERAGERTWIGMCKHPANKKEKERETL